MNLQNPVPIYEASIGDEAHLLVEFLNRKGLAAVAKLDSSTASDALERGADAVQTRVYVEQLHADQAAEIAKIFIETQRTRTTDATGEDEIEVECESCGATTSFAAALHGSTQNCAHCFAFIDVGEDDWMSEEEWGVADE